MEKDGQEGFALLYSRLFHPLPWALLMLFQCFSRDEVVCGMGWPGKEVR